MNQQVTAQQPASLNMTDKVATKEWEQAIQALRQRSFKMRLLIGLFQWLAGCSTPTRLRIGAALTWVTTLVIRRRVRIVQRNIDLCFPDRSAAERKQIVRDHLRALTQSFVDRSVFWFGPADQVYSLVHYKGHQQVAEQIAQHGAVMLLAPHFIALDAAATRFTYECPEGAAMYSPQRDMDIDELVRLGRSRFNIVHLISRRDGIRTLLRYIHGHIPIYYLPDMDFGRKGAVFVPFFGVQAATQTATAQISRKWKLPVLPVHCLWDPKTGHYSVEIGAPLEDFPNLPGATPENDSLEAATARLNQHLETWVRRCPSQYYWVHRRFKTRPEGEPKIY